MGRVYPIPSDGDDWRPQLSSDDRQSIVSKIVKTLENHITVWSPSVSGPDELSELTKVAERFEEKIYYSATSKSDYLRKVALKMLTVVTKSHTTGGANTLWSDTASSSQTLQVGVSAEDAE